MQIIIEPGGAVRCIYTEEIDLAAMGSPTISRASHVEPDQQGRWLADMSPRMLARSWGRFKLRSEALAAEQAWLEDELADRRPVRSLMLGRSLAGAFALPAEKPTKCHAVPSKDAIGPVGKPANNRPGQRGNEPAESYGPIGFADGFNPSHDPPIGQYSVHDAHHFRLAQAVGFRVEVRTGNVLGHEPALSIPTLQPFDLSTTERTLPIVQQLEWPVVHWFASCSGPA